MEKHIKDLAPLSYLDTVLIEFLRSYFEHHPEFKWDNDPSKTKILINNIYAFEEGDAGFYPRITVRRENFQIVSPTTVTNSPSGRPISNFAVKREKIFNVSAPFSIVVMARQPSQALDLLEEIIVLFMLYRDRIAERFGVGIKPYFSGQTERPQTVGKDIDATMIEFTIAVDYVYQLNIDYLPKYDTLKGLDLLEVVETKLDNELVDFKTISYKKQVEEL